MGRLLQRPAQRPFHKYLLGISVGVLLLSTLSLTIAQTWKTAVGFSSDWENLPITVEPLAESLYFIHGSGGNMLLFVGPDGSLLVDNEFSQLTERILKVVHEIHPAPVKYAFNTHWHSDHTGMNEELARTGTIVIAHDLARQRMLEPHFHDFFQSTTPAAEKEALPVITFPNSMSLHLNGESIEFIFIAPAHTDGDAIAWFPESNVIHLGDMYISELYPILDINSGADIDGYAPVIDQILEMIDEETQVVPGHGPVGDKSTLVEYRNMIVTIRNRVKEMIDQGLDIDQILARNPTREFDSFWASDRVGPDDMTMMVYLSLKKNAAKTAQ